MARGPLSAGHQVTERFASMDAHAYVDECLSREDRIAFEARLRDDAELRRSVDLWQAQNDGIRAAFRAPLRARGPISVGRPSNENLSAPMPPAIDSRRVGAASTPCDAPAAPPRTSPGDVRRIVLRPTPARRFWARALRWALISALASVVLMVWPAGGPPDERGLLIDAGLAAFRAFGGDSSVALDISSSDPRVLAKQLSPRFVARATAANFDLAGWTLIGARFVPGTASAAAFVLWENRDRVRMGLLIESLDAPASSMPRMREFGAVAISSWTEGGKGFAAVGPDASAVAELIRIGTANSANSFAAR
jgi:anti-sigma factor RsiW